MKALGSDILACYRDDAFFANWKDWCINTDDHVDEEGEPNLQLGTLYRVEDLSWTIEWQNNTQAPPRRTPWGVAVDIFSGGSRAEVSFLASFKAWKKQQTSTILAIEVPNEHLEVFWAWALEHGVKKVRE